MTADEPPRPAPQYGEYATPEQQQERIRLSGGDPAASAASLAPAPVTTAPPAGYGAPTPQATPAQSDAGARRPRADRFVTIFLLAYGLITVVTTIPQLVDFTTFADTWLTMAGVDAEFTQTALGRQWGAVSAVVFAVGWLLTAASSVWAILRRRLSWWIPVVGAVVTFTLVSVCLSIPLFSDPAIIGELLRAG